MRNPFSIVMLAALLLATLLAAAPTALAEETTCRGSIGARTVDNLRVPDGATCTLDGTRVKGTITVGGQASLKATQVSVVGNVQAENHKVVSLAGSTVGGSVQFDQGGPFKVANTKVTGSIQVNANEGESRLKANRVNADIQVFGHDGSVRIVDNRVDGNLQCKENVPAPTGGGNVVQGNKEDQCKPL